MAACGPFSTWCTASQTKNQGEVITQRMRSRTDGLLMGEGGMPRRRSQLFCKPANRYRNAEAFKATAPPAADAVAL
jgi:hypothetical protein